MINPVEYFKDLHDNVCNQKYAGKLPYSFHLELVAKQAMLFLNECKIENYYTTGEIYAVAYGHDSIEDARVTYNDIREMFGITIANSIYHCTEEKGKNRAERKNDKFYSELIQDRLATYIKLCDLIANIKFSLLTNSSMYFKYRDEWVEHRHHFKMYSSDFKPLFNYIDMLIVIQPETK